MRIKLSNGAIAPSRANSTDAGLDLKAAADYVLQPGTTTMVDTGVSIDMQEFDPCHNRTMPMVGLVFQRSGFTKLGVSLANSVGVIDASYRGNIIVALRNYNQEEAVSIQRGDRIAQIVFMPIYIPRALELFMGSDEEWLNTDRGAGGFGSSGK